MYLKINEVYLIQVKKSLAGFQTMLHPGALSAYVYQARLRKDKYAFRQSDVNLIDSDANYNHIGLTKTFGGQEMCVFLRK